jgi:hypothetical protein
MQQLQWIDLLGYLTHWYCGIMILFKYCILEFLCLFSIFFLSLLTFSMTYGLFFICQKFMLNQDTIYLLSMMPNVIKKQIVNTF